VRALLLVSVLAGCGGAEVDEGPCSLSDPCSGDSVCDYTAPEGPVCIPKSGDLDGDGLANDKDFCNHQAGGAYDEDQDGAGDDCDRCPIAPPREFPDSDSDMVDAPCDPEPTEDGNVILLFDGFQGQGLDDRWEPTTPTAWTQRPGEVTVTLDSIGTQEYLRTTVVGMNSIALEASYRVDRTETTSQQHIAGVFADDPRPAGVSEVRCYASKTDTDGSERVVIETNQGAMSEVVANTFNSANLYRAGAFASGTRAGCSMLVNGNPLGSVSAGITPDQLSQVALTAQAATVRFQYVIAVGR
jgi:hypothetical protein